jgi:catechol 2,3-dioxygenase-like lactoylglutathione lyase family enzyme
LLRGCSSVRERKLLYTAPAERRLVTAPYSWPMTLDLFAGVPVNDFAAARRWYERLLGSEPSFSPHATEVVWELAEHRFLYIVESENPGGALHTLFVDDLDARVAAIGARGLEPHKRETYSNGVRKVAYRDADGNEIGFGGAPAE